MRGGLFLWLRQPMVRAWVLALALTLAQGLIWWLVLPPWTAPDEPGHYLYTRLLADLGLVPARADNNAAIEAPVITSLVATDWWGYEGRPVPQPLPERLTEDAVLAASGAQFQGEPPLFYVAPALLLRWLDTSGVTDPALALRWLRLWSLSLRLIAVIASLFLALNIWPDRSERALGLGVLVGITPMVAFIGGSLNNDALTIAWGAVAFALLATASSGWRWLLALIVVITGPLLADKSLLFLWPLALFWALVKLHQLRNRRLLILAGFVVLVALLLAPNPRWAAGWERYSMQTHSRSSENALHLSDGRSDDLVRLSQVISNKSALALRGQALTLEAKFWGDAGSVLNLRVADGRQAHEQSCEVLSHQQKCELPFTLDPHASRIHIQTAIEDNRDQHSTSEIHLRLHLLDDSGRDLLYNGDGRFAAPLGAPLFAWLERRLPIPNGFFVRALSPTAWDAPAQFRYILFAGFTRASFWGYFGWLSRPLPWWVYTLLAGFTFLAVCGLFQWGMAAIKRRRSRKASRTDQLLVLSLAAFLLILVQVWTPMLGHAWQPQGRYLFSALLPISVILFLGWENAIAPRWRRYLVPSLILGLISFNILSWIIVV